MLSYEEFEKNLKHDGSTSDWLNVYIDKQGDYHIEGYGGMGTTIFNRLANNHPFITYIQTMKNKGELKESNFRREYSAGFQELAPKFR